MTRPLSLLITCEHGGNRVPPRYRPLFKGHAALLASHRGWDPGARVMAQELAAALGAPLYVSTTSRLLVDLNRSPGHPRLYSEATRAVPPETRREILAAHYLPYRNRIETHIANEVARGRRVVHIAAHSFTPVLHGEVRNADIGLLYDPARRGERSLCLVWQAALRQMSPALRVRRNYPYRGTSDGLTAHLRKRFGDREYAGIELEINQQWVIAGGRGWRELRGLVIRSLRQALAGG